MSRSDFLSLLFRDKLIEDYKIIDKSPCLAEPERFKIIAQVNRQLGEVLPVLFLSILNARFSESSGTLSYSFDRHNVVLSRNGELAVTFIKDEEELRTLMKQIIKLLNRGIIYTTGSRRAPQGLVDEKRKLNPMTIYGKLPQTNCKECGESGCYAFASKLFTGDKKLSDCPHLDVVGLKKLLQPFNL